jgi:predicted XRE-type DNA-binding protein
MPDKKNGRRAAESPFEMSSGNVFADLGLPNAEDRMTKAKLAHQISILVDAAGLTQAKAAQRLGIDQPKISKLLRGQLSIFSTERLIHFLTLLDQEVILTVRPTRRGHKPGLRVLLEA